MNPLKVNKMANSIIFSYNSTGFNFQKIDFIGSLLNTFSIDFFLCQEHFVLGPNSHIILNEFPDYEKSVMPAIKSNSSISRGRPSGGLFIMWKKTLNKRVSILKIDNSRLQAIEIDKNILLFNCYFPNDTQDQNFNNWDLQKCINDINETCVRFPNHSVIVSGDINVDFNRNTPFVNTVRDWTIDCNINPIWWKFFVDFTFSNFAFNRPSFSIIDHFLCNDNAETIVIDAGVIHLAENLSNHSPIFMKIELPPFKCNKPSSENETNNLQPKNHAPNWNKATKNEIDNFLNELESNLNSIKFSEGLMCNDVHCNNVQHRVDITVYTLTLLEMIDFSTKNNIPSSSVPHEKKILGWKEFVQPYKDEANFYHAVWLSYGKPINCNVHYAMKRTRNIYHYAIRKVKNNMEFLKNEKFLEHSLNKNPNELLNDFKKLKNSKNPKACSIDGHNSDNDIAQHFATIYSDLYNKTDSSAELENEYHYLDSLVVPNDMHSVECISPSLVCQIISKLDRRRNDSLYSFKSDAIVIGKNILCKYLAILYQAALIHGFLPKEILSAKLQPIVKNKLGDHSDSSNYRAIGISSIFLKILDLLFLHIFQNTLQVSDQQYGFQANCSTTFCTFTVKESVNYFLNRNTPVFACFLDMTKAFDLVNYHELFLKLRSRISPIFLRLLCFVYLNQTACVAWGESNSDNFSVKNGVKQGAIFSPTLFSIYIDSLFEVLKKSGFGCFIKNDYYGALAYADDIVLLCPSIKGLQSMLDISKKFFDDLGLIISFDYADPQKSKTKCLAFGTKIDPPPILLNNCPIPWVSKFKHLGHILYRDGSAFHDTILKKNVFIGKFHSLCQLLKQKDPIVYIKLIKVYLIDFYGSNLWNFYDAACQKFFTCWNRMIRNIFNLPYNSHRYLIQPISGMPHLKTMVYDRFLKFHDSVMNCNKKITKSLARLQAQDCRSDFGRNIRNLCNENKTFNFSENKKGDITYFPVSIENQWRVNLLKELLSPVVYINLTYDERKILIDWVSTS